MKQNNLVVWFTGLSGSGKSTLAQMVAGMLKEKNLPVYLLDGDKLREGLNKNLGYSDADRKENIRRAGEVARLFFDEGFIVLCTFISPFKEDRQEVRSHFPDSKFIEVFVNTPLEVCEQRDVKGLYKKARAGGVTDFTGISSGYEPPASPELEIQTDKISAGEGALQVFDAVLHRIHAKK